MLFTQVVWQSVRFPHSTEVHKSWMLFTQGVWQSVRFPHSTEVHKSCMLFPQRVRQPVRFPHSNKAQKSCMLFTERVWASVRFPHSTEAHKSCMLFPQMVWQSVRFPRSRLGGSLQRGPSRTHLSHMQPSPHARWRWAKGRLVYLPWLLQHCVTLKTVQSPMSFTVHPVCCSTV